MNPATSHRMQAVQSPVVPAIAQLIRDNPGTVSLGQGVAWYGPPDQSFQLVQQEMQRAENQLYAPVEGIAPLREALGRKLQCDNDVNLSGDRELVVTAGANMGFLNAIMAITDPGDEIILLSPYYFNHEMTIRMLDCRVVAVNTDERFHPDIDAIAAAITDRTRAIVSISPNNPSGAVYTATELQAINTLCRERGLYHISDEAYEYFTYDDNVHYSVASAANSTDHTISLFSLSKSFGFAGWRIGYMLIPADLYGPVQKVQDSNLICASTVSQYAALGAVNTGNEYCKARQDVIRQNRDIALSACRTINNVSQCLTAEGAFYLLLHIDTELDDYRLCRRLIEDFSVAVIPGRPFGLEQECYIRVSYGAMACKEFELAMQRLTKGLNALTDN
ncbi:MAG: pyridoxal phosphate-dependent aminotransferase [Thiotrichales bacterium]|nr:pyridoxal phosphate-dependent aminotransferase [Thiotrichales bacterium]